ncbi:MAG: hypothetical protein KM310_00490 [Clostridiales bacterium]|nr:hypothetical protein [Clostridiales bacterium]
MNVQKLSPGIEDDIRKAIQEAEARARARLIEPEHLRIVFEAMRKQRHGTAYLDGGHVSNSYRYRAETSYAVIAWVTIRGETWVSYDAWRDRAKHFPYGAGPQYDISSDREKAMRLVFPDRVAKRNRRWLRWRLKRVGADPSFNTFAPDRAENFTLMGDDQFALLGNSWRFFLITPVGVFWDYGKTPKSIAEALRHFRVDRESATSREAFIETLLAQCSPTHEGWAAALLDTLRTKTTRLPFLTLYHEVREAIHKQPYGIALYLAHDVYEGIAWYTLRRTKNFLRLRVSPLRVALPAAETPRVILVADKRKAWQLIHPGRYQRFLDLKARRRLKRAGLQGAVKSLRSIRLVDIWEEARLALIEDRFGDLYLVTPSRAMAIPPGRAKRNQTVRQAFRKAFGFPLPRKRDLRWEEIETLIALHAMGE